MSYRSDSANDRTMPCVPPLDPAPSDLALISLDLCDLNERESPRIRTPADLAPMPDDG